MKYLTIWSMISRIVIVVNFLHLAFYRSSSMLESNSSITRILDPASSPNHWILGIPSTQYYPLGYLLTSPLQIIKDHIFVMQTRLWIIFFLHMLWWSHFLPFWWRLCPRSSNICLNDNNYEVGYPDKSDRRPHCRSWRCWASSDLQELSPLINYINLNY